MRLHIIPVEKTKLAIFGDNLEKVKIELLQKGKILLQKKLENYIKRKRFAVVEIEELCEPFEVRLLKEEKVMASKTISACTHKESTLLQILSQETGVGTDEGSYSYI